MHGSNFGVNSLYQQTYFRGILNMAPIMKMGNCSSHMYSKVQNDFVEGETTKACDGFVERG